MNKLKMLILGLVFVFIQVVSVTVAKANTADIKTLSKEQIKYVNIKEELNKLNSSWFEFEKYVNGALINRYVVTSGHNSYYPAINKEYNQYSALMPDNKFTSFYGYEYEPDGSQPVATEGHFGLYNEESKTGYKFVDSYNGCHLGGADVPQENVSKFLWEGDGIRIETPPDKTSLITTKYKDKPGVFVNILLKTNERPPNKLFSDIEEDISKNLKYKWKKTGTEEVLESGKVKVTDIEVVNGFLERGETRYRIKGFISIDTKGVYDLYVSSEFEVLNVDNPLKEKRVYYEDTNFSIQIRNEQYSGIIDDVIEGNTGGSSNSNGSVETGAPQKPNSANPVDWLIYIVDLVTYWINSITDGMLMLISSLVNAFTEVSSELFNAVENFGRVFAKLPSPLPQLTTLTITIACGTTIFRLIRR